MNIIPPVPTPTIFNAGTVNTESVRRDNIQRETVPAISSAENSAAESGVGSDADKVKTPGQAPQPLTYEKPTPQAGQPLNNQNESNQDNGQDQSAGKESAEQKQQQQADEQQTKELKERDAEVRTHEQAHASVGGQYAGSPKYEYEIGPDGKQYAVSGEVSIDVSKESTPEETIRKAQQVKAAALAPAEPSAADLRVAAEASQIALEARTEIASEKSEQAHVAFRESSPSISEESNSNIFEGPELDEIVDAIDEGPHTRALDNSSVLVDNESGQQSFEFVQDAANQALQNRSLEITRRVSVIENFYQQVSNPKGDNLRQSA
ncbi:putative metalloprotease CJM1_0395 family protein [uncultured Paraglaciecola sp.]|uniref:putative metalloprotease CJM1_0395 family protein n=1 Tax=uncultured Paraglaciecola sp. TaxID=1765024 RepID=UPI0025925AD1|nr:putative metalloprotease CJM1_0395 family protein [uncultured Paraglaciecola sp.]